MQEQLISFETAKLAKEKGFNLTSTYNNVWDLGDNTPMRNVNIATLIKVKEGEDYILCPTQSLLQKWLLEIHNIHITIFSKSHESWMYRVTKKGQSLEEGLYGEDFYSHEEAREEALFEALSLLPDKN